MKTIVFSKLSKDDKSKYFNFLLENDINFSRDEQGNYVALVKVLNPAFYSGGEQKETEKLRTNQEIRPTNRSNRNDFPGGEVRKDHKNASRSLPKNQQKSLLDNFNVDYKDTAGKRTTAKRYKESFGSIKKELGNYKLSNLTPYILNQALLKLYHNSSTKEALRNYQKVIKSSLRDAACYFGFIKNNSSIEINY